MLRCHQVLHSVKILTTRFPKQVICVSINRERLFGADTIEEAMKVVDSVSSKGNPVRVLAGINDQEFNLIDKSVSSRNSLRGRFMSPLVVMCRQNQIPVDFVGRRLTATSSRLSTVVLKHPLEFYKAIWLVVFKSWALIRAPHARRYLDKLIPNLARSYLAEGSEMMALKTELCLRKSDEDLIVTVPMENSQEVLQILEEGRLAESSDDILERRIEAMDSDGSGYWLPVAILYLFLPIALLFELFKWIGKNELTELANYETQGIALGTWVRDSRRD
jgi:hypothetical protein